MLGDELDHKIQAYVQTLHNNVGSVTTAIVSAAARGILMKVSRSMLSKYGGPATLTKAWAQSLLQRMGFVKLEVSPSVRFLLRILSHCEMNILIISPLLRLWLIAES